MRLSTYAIIAVGAHSFVVLPQKALYSPCTSKARRRRDASCRRWDTPCRRRDTPCRRAKDDGEDGDDAVEDLIRRARASREVAPPEAARVEEALPDEGAANPELSMEEVRANYDAVLDARRKEAQKLARDQLAAESEGARERARADKTKWPKFGANNVPPAAVQSGGLDNVFGGGAPRFELTEETMKDPELQALVRRQMVDAFDNRREDEVDVMFARLWHAGPIKTVWKLVEAALDAQDVSEAYQNGLLSDEGAGDEIRCCRSRIRMYAKDAEFLPNADGSPAADAWGSLDDWVPWRWRP